MFLPEIKRESFFLDLSARLIMRIMKNGISFSSAQGILQAREVRGARQQLERREKKEKWGRNPTNSAVPERNPGME